ncbi:MAG: hypothetical protein ABGX27_07965 [Desulfurobacteriaceae bacterium]
MIDIKTITQKALIRLPFASEEIALELANDYVNEPNENIALYKLCIALIAREISSLQSARIGDLEAKETDRLNSLKETLSHYEKLLKQEEARIKFAGGIVELSPEEPVYD